MRLSLTPDELLSTTRAVRRRLDLERPVEREVLLECLELATQAPSGSNSQRWHFVLVTEPDKRQALADLYNRVFQSAYSPDAREQMDDAMMRVWVSAEYLAQHFHEVPVLLVPCLWTRPPERPAEQAAYWGSVLPAVWSFMLAARERGLGTVYTSLHLYREKQAAEILGIPYDECGQAGLVPVAYTKGTDFKPAVRKPIETILHWDTW